MFTHMFLLFRSKKRAPQFQPEHSRANFFPFSRNFENTAPENVTIFENEMKFSVETKNDKRMK